MSCIPVSQTNDPISYCLGGHTHWRYPYFDCFAPSKELISGEAVGFPELVLTRVDRQIRFSLHPTRR